METLKNVLFWVIIDFILLVNVAIVCGIVKDSVVKGYREGLKAKEEFWKSLGAQEQGRALQQDISRSYN